MIKEQLDRISRFFRVANARIVVLVCVQMYGHGNGLIGMKGLGGH